MSENKIDNRPITRDIPNTKKLTGSQIKAMHDRDAEMVKGIFRFYEIPGGCMDFVYKAYKEDPVERYSMHDGEVYSIPVGVARHLNKNGWYPEYSYMPGESGVQNVTKVTKKIRRFGFQSLEFVDTADLSEDNLVTAEYVR